MVVSIELTRQQAKQIELILRAKYNAKRDTGVASLVKVEILSIIAEDAKRMQLLSEKILADSD